ncbi:MAG: L-histidine N(alpha)-methyltransferase, partial [Thermoleophilaceae bacterium]|nr:L-histidine N(alpha)-methyltransferase [Thermoleophilaceae bacterium]
RSTGAQHVRVPGAGIEVDFADGEEMRTEVSTKFTSEGVEGELRDAGLVLREFLTDDAELYGLAVASKPG